MDLLRRHKINNLIYSKEPTLQTHICREYIIGCLNNEVINCRLCSFKYENIENSMYLILII